ncbi:MAG: hypothetical protein IIA62_10230 [Nitrospinae bacterium]|nr:hypothetical protein [Nitrospinota bacterium]
MPTLKSDKEAEEFIERSDLTEFDLSGGKRVHFEFSKKSKTVSLKIFFIELLC